MENSSSQSFWHFSDQIRLQTANLANLSIGGGDNIWSDSFLAKKRPEDRRNFDITAAPDASSLTGQIGNQPQQAVKPLSDFNSNGWKDLNNANGWKLGLLGNSNRNNSSYSYFNKEVNTNTNINSYFSKEVNTNTNTNSYFNKEFNSNTNSYFNKEIARPGNYFSKDFSNNNKNSNNVNGGKNNKKSNNNNRNNNNDDNGKSAVDKRFKTLPASEALPRDEAIGGYIFVCNNDTMQENLRRQLFGLPPRYRDSVRAITPGLPLFLYNYSTHQLHGIFEAASFGGTNIDPTAWEDKKCVGESRFPAQVRVAMRKMCEPLEEDSFRPILHHYDGPKFRLELNIPEALALLDIFADNSA